MPFKNCRAIFLQCFTQDGISFYMNSVEAIVKIALGNPEISECIMRYPDRWLNDPRFFSPMVQSTCGNVYLHDFVMFHKANGCRQGRVNKFFSKVSQLLFQCVYL